MHLIININMKHGCMLLLVIGTIVPVSLTNPLINAEPDSDIEEYVFENDIIVYDLEEDEHDDSMPDAVASPLRLWEKKGMEVIIPYTTPNGLTSHQNEHINQAINEFHIKTCIVFEPRTNQTDYVLIDPVNFPISCRSTVGRKGGKQTVRAGNCKINGTFNYGPLLHELMHTIGFVHEQTRSDRDEHINVDFEAIKNFEKDEGWPNGTWAKQFTKCNLTRFGKKWGCKVLNPYDANSITHYPSTYLG